MKARCSLYSRCVGVGTVILAAAALVATRPATAQVDVPFADSFESYTNNAPLDGTNGWASGSGVETAAVVIVQGYDFPLRKPLESEAHTQIVQLMDAVTNFLNHAPGADSNIWVDLMVLPVRSSVTPEVDDNIQLALYFNEEGHIVIRHRYLDYANVNWPAAWSELMHPPQPTDEWARVTIRLNYQPGPTGLGGGSNDTDRFFQVMLNGSEPLTHPYGFTSIPIDFSEEGYPAYTNGSWFLFMNTGGPNNSPGNNLGPTNISSVAIQGTGYFDDFVVTNSDVFAATRWLVEATSDEGGFIYPGGNLLVPNGDSVTFSIIQTGVTNLVDVLVNGQSIGPTNSVTLVNVTSNQTVHASFITPPPYTGRGVSVDWLASYGLTEADEEGDADNDGAKNWEEYVAGTDPTDSNSVFTVLSVMYGAGSNRVTWFGTLDSGVTNYFSMLRSTNELPDDIWELVLSNSLPRDPSGTNVWWDPSPPVNGKVFYRPTILWNIE